MSQRPARGGATASFANLRALITGKPARAENDRRPEDEDDEEARQARRAEEDKRREEEDARRAEEDDRRNEEDARRAEEEDDDDADANRADMDDENCEEEDGDDKDKAAAAKAGRRAENVRWSKVLGAVRPDQVAGACTMLADTDLNSGQILATLNALPSTAPAPRGGRESLQERMSKVRVPPLGGDGGSKPAPQGSPAGVAEFVLAADRRRRGEA